VTPEPWDFGERLSGHRWRAAEPRATLLLQHGYGEYAGRYVDRYHRLIPHLVERGFDVHAFDTQGHGGSPGERGLVDVERTVAAHLAARRRLGDRPLFLLGHSLGGLVTAASVAREPTGVAGVVLSAPALLIRTNPVLRRLAPMLARFAPSLGVQPPLDPSGISRLEDEVAAYRTDPALYRGKLPALTGATALAVSEDGWGRYPRWDAPTLVVHGDADGFTDPEGSRRFVGAIRSADKELIAVPEGRHELLNDAGRDRVLAAVLDWLSARAIG
jgi:alpha-beta hydrolase superfamily lysophospholipase